MNSLLFCIIVTLELAAVTATKVVQCKSTYRGKLKEPGVADHRALCTLSTSFPDNSDMCVSTDTRGDISGYYSVPDNWPTLCVTFIYKEENVSEFIRSVALYRGVSQLKNANTCAGVCDQLKLLVGAQPTITIFYVGCVPRENGNDEDVNKIDYSKPTAYTCKTSDNYYPTPPTTTTTSTTTTTTRTTTPSTTQSTTTIKSDATTAPTGPPSWLWPVVGALVGLLVIMAVGLLVEILLSRSTFNEIAKTSPTNDMPMS